MRLPYEVGPGLRRAVLRESFPRGALIMVESGLKAMGPRPCPAMRRARCADFLRLYIFLHSKGYNVSQCLDLSRPHKRMHSNAVAAILHFKFDGIDLKFRQIDNAFRICKIINTTLLLLVRVNRKWPGAHFRRGILPLAMASSSRSACLSIAAKFSIPNAAAATSMSTFPPASLSEPSSESSESS